MEYRLNKNEDKKPEKKPAKTVKKEIVYDAEGEDLFRRKVKKTGLWKFCFVLFILFIVFSVGLVSSAVLFVPKLNTIRIPNKSGDLGIISSVEHGGDKEELNRFHSAQENTLNILLLGLDGEGYDNNVRSDVIIVASITKGSDKIQLTSIQRDTMAYIPYYDGTYEKINHSYAYGGAELTMKTLNMNYDLNIHDVVVFDFNALVSMVDAIGGVKVNVTPEILNEVNRYTANGAYIESPGEQVISGSQALGYVRARYGAAGGVLGRDARQREVLYQVFNYAKGQSIKNLVSLAKKVLPTMQTSYDMAEITELIEFFDTVRGAKLSEAEFPYNYWGGLVGEIYYSVPRTAESNTVEMHKRLFGVEDYRVSDRAKEFSNTIINLTSVE